jgi:hypothetical protein
VAAPKAGGDEKPKMVITGHEIELVKAIAIPDGVKSQVRKARKATGGEKTGPVPGQTEAGTSAGSKDGKTPDIEGAWRARDARMKYEIRQNGKKFEWNGLNFEEHGAGKFAGPRKLKAKWDGEIGKGHGKGTITKIRRDGTALVIKWDTGVVFERIEPPQPEIMEPEEGGHEEREGRAGRPDISGVWHDEDGLPYRIEVRGDGFTYRCLDDDRQGRGEFTEDGRIRADWEEERDEMVRGEIVAVEHGRAMRVEWENGMTFIRPEEDGRQEHEKREEED